MRRFVLLAASGNSAPGTALAWFGFLGAIAVLRRRRGVSIREV